MYSLHQQDNLTETILYPVLGLVVIEQLWYCTRLSPKYRTSLGLRNYTELEFSIYKNVLEPIEIFETLAMFKDSKFVAITGVEIKS